jgi:hypothetical protein
MSKQTTDNFWQAFNTWDTELSCPVFYRLYYNDDGSPKTYTMEDLPGNYIEVDRDTYVVGSYNVRVIDQKLVHLAPQNLITKLQPNAVAGTACDPQDVCVVVSDSMPHTKWSLQ